MTANQLVVSVPAAAAAALFPTPASGKPRATAVQSHVSMTIIAKVLGGGGGGCIDLSCLLPPAGLINSADEPLQKRICFSEQDGQLVVTAASAYPSACGSKHGQFIAASSLTSNRPSLLNCGDISYRFCRRPRGPDGQQ